MAQFHTSEEHKKLVSDLIQKKRTYEKVMEPWFERAVKNWGNFIGDIAIKDPRDPEKQRWRSFVNTTKAWANTTAVAATITNIITSSNPLIQVTKTRDLNTEDALFGERLCNYVMKGNRFRSRILPPLVRNTEIQTTQLIKLSWQNRSRILVMNPAKEEFEAFWEAVIAAKNKNNLELPDPKEDPEAFDQWLEMQRSTGVTIPEMPKRGEQPVKGYIGPWYTLPNFWNTFYNPFEADMQCQEVVYERIAVPQSYVDARSDPNDPSAIFDREAVLEARKRRLSERFNKYETKYFRLLDIQTSEMQSNSTEPWDEILECHMPSHPEIQFAVIMNESVIINKDMDNPNPFGDIPYVDIQRMRSSNATAGMTPYKANESMLYELTAMRSSRLDIVSLVSNPAYTLTGGAASLPTVIEPGGMYPVNNHDAIKQIETRVPPELFRESELTSQTIDEGWGVGGNVRGQQAEINRVSLGEHQSRLAQATLPLIEFAREIEDGLNITIPWIFHMFKKYATEDMKIALLGNTLTSIDPAKLTQVLNMDYSFTGATQTGNRGELSQLMLMFMKQFNEVFLPEERRKMAKTVAGLMGIPGMDEILPDPNPALEAAKMMLGGAAGAAAGGIPGVVEGQGGPAMPSGAAPPMPTGAVPPNVPVPTPTQ